MLNENSPSSPPKLISPPKQNKTNPPASLLFLSRSYPRFSPCREVNWLASQLSVCLCAYLLKSDVTARETKGKGEESWGAREIWGERGVERGEGSKKD